MPDQLEELFADLRADTLPRVRPPGTQAARHTVRRRRTTRTVATAAVVLAAAGGLIASNLQLARERQAPPAERQNNPVDTAKRALDTQLPRLAGRPMAGTVEAEGKLTFPDLRPGGYTLAVTCAGPGVVAIDAELVRSADESAVLGGQVVSCADSPIVAVMTFRLPAQGPVVISAAGDPLAAGTAGFALELGDGDGSGGYQPGTEALQDDDAVPADESVWNAGRAADVLAAGGTARPVRVTTEQMRSEQSTDYVTPGDFELRIACAGPGSLTLTVAAVPPGDGEIDDSRSLMSGEIECHDSDPQMDGADILTLPKNSRLVIIAVPDQAARNRAGWAYQAGPA